MYIISTDNGNDGICNASYPVSSPDDFHHDMQMECFLRVRTHHPNYYDKPFLTLRMYAGDKPCCDIGCQIADDIRH